LPLSIEVFQFWLPLTTWTRPRTIGLTRSTIPTCWAMAWASSRVSVLTDPAPWRTAPGPRPKLPAET